MNVSGEATFEIEGGALVFVATLKGLELYSAHPLTLSAGDCAHQGARAFSFYPAQADGQGWGKDQTQVRWRRAHSVGLVFHGAAWTSRAEPDRRRAGQLRRCSGARWAVSARRK